MRRSLGDLVAVLFSTENISTSFYLLVLVPLALVSYFSIHYPFGLVVPLYGVILLILKKHKLFSQPKAGSIQKLLGLIVIISSFLAYFIVSPFFPKAALYGFANYTLYIIGLFLIFFHFRALKEAFSPLFLVAAFVTSFSISDLLGSWFTPFIPHLTSFIASILSALGIVAKIPALSPNTIVLDALTGSIWLTIDWACVGFTSIYIFSVILVIIMAEDPSSIKTKVIWSIIGVLGTFSIGIIRLVTIFTGFYFLGSQHGEAIHSYLGYILFITWSVIFLYLFSKRSTILQKIRTIYART